MAGMLIGKAVVITGAGSGLGAAYARHAASQGAAVIVNDVNAEAAAATARSIEEAGGRAGVCIGDVSDWSFADELIRSCRERFDAFDGLVNNAGILRPGRLEDLREPDLRRMLEINLVGTAACARAAVLALRAMGRPGAIVNVASGSQAGDIALGAYGASKAAIASLTYSWAMELRGSAIRMNAISPLAETAMSAQNTSFMAIQAANRDVHYAVLPDPAVSAPLVGYLLADASAGINGQLVRIAGRQLSFVTHPVIASPVLESDWTAETIATAFAETLAHHQHKLGLTYADPPPG